MDTLLLRSQLASLMRVARTGGDGRATCRTCGGPLGTTLGALAWKHPPRSLGVCVGVRHDQLPGGTLFAQLLTATLLVATRSSKVGAATNAVLERQCLTGRALEHA